VTARGRFRRVSAHDFRRRGLPRRARCVISRHSIGLVRSAVTIGRLPAAAHAARGGRPRCSRRLCRRANPMPLWPFGHLGAQFVAVLSPTSFWSPASGPSRCTIWPSTRPSERASHRRIAWPLDAGRDPRRPGRRCWCSSSDGSSRPSRAAIPARLQAQADPVGGRQKGLKSLPPETRPSSIQLRRRIAGLLRGPLGGQQPPPLLRRSQ